MKIISLNTNEINQNGYHFNKLTRNKIGFIYTAPIKIVPDDCLACDGYVLKIEDYGIFVELTPNLAGLAEVRPNTKIGQSVSVYIKSIIPEKMKIKLIIVETFDKTLEKVPIKYFIESKSF